MQTVDVLIIGAGIVGVTTALALKRRSPGLRIVLLEKEPATGRHSSGRNSGVLHSGIYYPPGSLKAAVCHQGAIEMAAFHREHGLRLRECGKLLVTARDADQPQLELLAARAVEHGIPVERLDAQQLGDAEPDARSASGEALYVPMTSVGDPAAVMRVLTAQLTDAGIALRLGTALQSVDTARRVATLTDGDRIAYGHAVNTAGLYADRVAQQFGCAERYTLLPFKGLYWKLDPRSGLRFRHLVYPVPDLRVPFLGIHTTTTVDGATYLGPSAVPAFGRENYHGLRGVVPGDALSLTARLTRQFLANHDGFRRLAWQEGRRLFKPWFADAARAIVPRLRTEHLLPTDKVGMRAQLVDLTTQTLVTDFLVEQGADSTHVLNAISPAWTSAFPLARHLCDRYLPV